MAQALNAPASPLITVRDRLGYRLLEGIGVGQPIHLTADPALPLEPEDPRWMRWWRGASKSTGT